MPPTRTHRAFLCGGEAEVLLAAFPLRTPFAGSVDQADRMLEMVIGQREIS